MEIIAELIHALRSIQAIKLTEQERGGAGARESVSEGELERESESDWSLEELHLLKRLVCSAYQTAKGALLAAKCESRN